MKKFLIILVSIFFYKISNAQSTPRQFESFAIGGFFIVAIIGILVFYLIWKKTKKEKTDSHDNYKIKTFEVVKNGRKVVMTKKYRVTNEYEFPESVKRKKI